MIHHAQSLAAVFLSLAEQLFQGLHFRLIEGNQQLAGLLIGHIQLRTQRFKIFIAFHAELRHQSARLVIKAGVNHCGIAAAGSCCYITAFIHHADSQLTSGKLPGNGTAYSTGTYNQNIKLFIHIDRIPFCFSFLQVVVEFYSILP